MITKTMALKRIRGRRLQSIRASHLRAQPLCAHCLAMTPQKLTQATELDHIQALINGGTNDTDNYQSLCKECHKVKTALDLGHKQRTTTGLDGWPI